MADSGLNNASGYYSQNNNGYFEVLPTKQPLFYVLFLFIL